MDNGFVGLSNDLVGSQTLVELCNHGQPWESCTNKDCREILGLYAKAIQEERREYEEWVYTQNARKKRRKGKSQYEIALEKSRVSKVEDYELKLPEDVKAESQLEPADSRKLFRNIFPDEMTIRAAVQFRVLTPRQASLLRAYLSSDDDLVKYKRWDEIGTKIGWSGKTVEREFQKLVSKFLRSRETSDNSGALIKVVHVRGERKPRYYRIRSIQIGEWRRDWSELITDKRIIRGLRRNATPMIRLEKTRVLSSPVNRLFGALIRHFASDLPAGDVRPYDVTVHDWEYNLRKAERLLKRKSPGPWTALEVYYALGRGTRSCRACRTFLIRGFRIGGRKITRAREFCDNACKVRADRRKKRTRYH